MCRHRKQTCGCQAGARYKRDGREFGISRCKLLYIEWINNKVQLYSTGSYIQYPVINHMEKNMEKNVYVCITESFFCIAEINTTL